MVSSSTKSKMYKNSSLVSSFPQLSFPTVYVPHHLIRTGFKVMMIDRSRDFRIAGDHLLFTSTIGTLYCGIIGALLTKVPDFHWLPRSPNELPAASRTVTILKTTIHNAVLIVWFFTVFENIPVRLPGGRGGSGQSLQCLIPGIKCLYL
jgi:hypothetical protein